MSAVELVSNAGYRLLFLPPYCPQLNPIEKLCANIKSAWVYREEISLEDFLTGGGYAWD